MNYDLTTKQGIKKVINVLDRVGLNFPEVYLIIFVLEGINSIMSPTDVIDKQKETACQLIKAGKKNNVDKMTITLDQLAGIDFGSDIEGIPIKCKIGKGGKMTIDVLYKKQNKKAAKTRKKI